MNKSKPPKTVKPQLEEDDPMAELFRSRPQTSFVVPEYDDARPTPLPESHPEWTDFSV
jgi:hypothetical protein